MTEEMKKNTKTVFIITGIILIIGVLFYAGHLFLKGSDKKPSGGDTPVNEGLNYSLSGNSFEDFDLAFLQFENNKNNKVYSPISIKYGLKMLEDGTNGVSNEEITKIVGFYGGKKYNNSNNISFGNALFVKDIYRDAVKASYIDALQSKYGAEVVYDSFTSPDVVNNWVSEKTLKLINNVTNKIDGDFLLVNALGIDVEWTRELQSTSDRLDVSFEHEKYNEYVGPLSLDGYSSLDFNGSKKVSSTKILAVANKYDIINDLGEEYIRNKVTEEYSRWIADGAPGSCDGLAREKDTNSYVNQYMEDIKKSYHRLEQSTDFSYYVDDSIKVFAKDLKEYDGVALQYIGVMPREEELAKFIKRIDSASINSLINSLKTIDMDSFADGIITEVAGFIPLFKFDYELDILNDLKKIGISEVFNSNKADLSNLMDRKVYISDVKHKANISFSNSGIKAGAVFSAMGAGAGGCGFDYKFDVPVEKVDITFDKPFIFIIRDKNSGEVWFAGTVYEPEEYNNQ